MSLTVSELGGLMLLVFGVLRFLGIFANPRAVLAFLGVVVIGSAGFLGNIFATAGSWIQSTGGSVTQWALGVPLVAAPAIAVGIILIHDLHPKNTAGKRTDLLAILAGAFIVVGVAGIPALSGLHSIILQLVGNAQAALSSAAGG
jgi:hypothetical protein